MKQVKYGKGGEEEKESDCGDEKFTRGQRGTEEADERHRVEEGGGGR